MADYDEEEAVDEEYEEFRDAPVERQSNGLPKKSPYPQGVNPMIVYPIVNLLILAFGLFVAYLVHMYAGGKANSEAKMGMLRKYELGYLYIAVVVLAFAPKILNIFVAVERDNSHASVPDQYVFKVMRPAATIANDLSYIMLETNGPVGRFNRAQRAAGLLMEGLPTHLACSLAAGFVFPLPVLVLSVLFVLAKTWAAAGYTQATSTRRSGPTFLISAVVEGMTLFAGLGATI